MMFIMDIMAWCVYLNALYNDPWAQQLVEQQIVAIFPSYAEYFAAYIPEEGEWENYVEDVENYLESEDYLDQEDMLSDDTQLP
mmetsp:Transcript_5849/g.7847  ORF Transcript_5849/g.7847 Transcript_5849/m.7847 type:complete len:83 (+) Transcript_5849:101-349(+)